MMACPIQLSLLNNILAKCFGKYPGNCTRLELKSSAMRSDVRWWICTFSNPLLVLKKSRWALIQQKKIPPTAKARCKIPIGSWIKKYIPAEINHRKITQYNKSQKTIWWYFWVVGNSNWPHNYSSSLWGISICTKKAWNTNPCTQMQQ